ncbi:unnamed protein product [Somion occarium]|uniref:Uncharacterized protein n=1 Tax=Somion occarium TaxID=3059160 RepID=A0ABP1E3N8_9APHY
MAPSPTELSNFDEVAADALSLTLTQTTTSRTTIRGIGADTGRFIMSIGDMLLRGIENVSIQIRLQSLATALNFEERVNVPAYISSRICTDLLELQRVGLYSIDVRRQAWRMILFVLEREHGATQVANAIVDWPPVEIQLLIRQLAMCKLSDWTLYPGADQENGQRVKTPPDARPSISGRQRRLTQNFHLILSELIVKDPAIFHDVYDIHDFADLQTDYVLRGKISGDMPPVTRFLTSFALTYKPHSSWDPRGFDLQPMAVSMVRFIASGRPEYASQFVDALMDVLLVFAHAEVTSSDIQSIYDRYPGLRSRGLAHLSQPFLIFAMHMACSSKRASQLFLQAGLLRVVAYLSWKRAPHSQLGTASDADSSILDNFRSACLHVVAILAFHCSTDACADDMFKAGLEQWIIDEGTVDDRRLRTSSSLRYGERIDFQNQIHALVLSTLETIASRPQGYYAPASHFYCLSGILLSRYIYASDDLPEREYTVARIVLYCAASLEGDWFGLIDFLCHGEQRQCYAILHAVYSYLHDTLRLPLTSHNAETLRSMSRRTAARDVIVTNPVDRFLILIARAGGYELPILQYFNDAGFLSLLKDLLRGWYDFLEETPILNPILREKRENICRILEDNCKLLRGIVHSQGILTEVPF